MKIKLNFYIPYLYYEISSSFRKFKQLNEIEAMILVAIKYSDSKSKQIYDYLLEKFNLNEKFKPFIKNILLKMYKNNEITLKSGSDVNSDIDEFLLVDDIIINQEISNNLDKNEYLGFDSNIIKKNSVIIFNYKDDNNPEIKNFSTWEKPNNYFIIDNKEWNELLELKNKNKHAELLELIADKYNTKEEVLINIDILNQDKINGKSNIINIETPFEFEIDHEVKTLNNFQTRFINFIEDAKKYDFLNDNLKLINKNNLIIIDSYEKIDEVKNHIIDSDQYQDLLKYIDINKLDYENGYIVFYKQQFVKIGICIREYLLNQDKNNLIKLPIISYDVLDITKLKNLLLKIFDKLNWIKFYEECINNEQKQVIFGYILENYQHFFNIDEYRYFIIKNINLCNIEFNWILGELVDLNDFKKIINELSENKFNNLFSNEKQWQILDINKQNISKINWLYEQKNFQISKFKLDNFDEYKKYMEINSIDLKILNFEEINNLEDQFKLIHFNLNEFQNKFNNFKKQLEDYKYELIKVKKDELIKSIISFVKNKVQGEFDSLLTILTNSNNTNKEKINLLDKKYDKNFIQNLNWIKDIRNNISHKKYDDLILEYNKKDLKTLQNEFDQIKLIMDQLKQKVEEKK